MNSETMQAGTRVCFLADGEFCGGQWTGFYSFCGEYVILCDYCSRLHWLNPEDFLPIPDLEPEDFASPQFNYREWRQKKEDEEQAQYLVRHATNPRPRYAALAFPLIVAGLGACIVGVGNIAYGNYGYGGLGLLVFVGAFVLAGRLERA